MFRADISVSRDGGDVTSQPSAGSYQSQATAAATLRSLGAYRQHTLSEPRAIDGVHAGASWRIRLNGVCTATIPFNP